MQLNFVQVIILFYSKEAATRSFISLFFKLSVFKNVELLLHAI